MLDFPPAKCNRTGAGAGGPAGRCPQQPALPLFPPVRSRVGRPWKLAAVLTAVFFALWVWGSVLCSGLRPGGGGLSSLEFRGAGSADSAGRDGRGFGDPGAVARAGRNGRVTAPAGGR